MENLIVAFGQLSGDVVRETAAFNGNEIMVRIRSSTIGVEALVCVSKSNGKPIACEVLHLGDVSTDTALKTAINHANQWP